MERYKAKIRFNLKAKNYFHLGKIQKKLQLLLANGRKTFTYQR